MEEFDKFRKTLDDMIRNEEEKARQRNARLEASEEKLEKLLLEFDSHADRLQDEVIRPRVEYLSSLFEHAREPEVEEGVEYRHRIRVHFGHTKEFPCTADVTFIITHAEKPGYYDVKFDYIILPTYMTEHYKANENVRIKYGDESHPEVVAFVESSIETFIQAYFGARRT